MSEKKDGVLTQGTFVFEGNEAEILEKLKSFSEGDKLQIAVVLPTALGGKGLVNVDIQVVYLPNARGSYVPDYDFVVIGTDKDRGRLKRTMKAEHELDKGLCSHKWFVLGITAGKKPKEINFSFIPGIAFAYAT